MLARYSEVQDRFRLSDGYQIELKVATVLRGLGFEPEVQEQLTDHLSGGWQMRLALAKLLLSEPDLLLLDEPTNHLDLDARNWLEEYLVAYPHAVILVSHDRYFLDAVVTHIADLTLRKITEYHTNYTKYLEQRDAATRAAARSQAAAGRRDPARRGVHQPLPLPGDEGGAGAEPHQDAREGRAPRGAARAQAHPLPVPGGAEERAHGARAEARAQGVRRQRSCSIASTCTSSAAIASRSSATTAPASRRLMRMLSGEEQPDAGTRTEGHQVVMQYFAQDEATRLDPALTVYETLSAGSPHTMVPAIRNILGGFLFSGDDVYKKAGVLSGGERTRLAVARMLLRPSNTLLLDEPTNHLDIDSKEVLLDALADYGGTLIFVSHDRYFVEKLATKIIEVGDGKATLYPGDYEVVPVEQGQAGARRRRSATGAPSRECQSRHQRTRRTAPQPVAPLHPLHPLHRHPTSYDDRKRESRREAEARAGVQGAEGSRRRARGAHRRSREGHQGRRAGDGRARTSTRDHEKSKPVLAQHQALMWEVGELLGQWEMLQNEAEQFADLRNS